MINALTAQLNRFTTCLDADKSGLRLISGVARKDRADWDRPRPESMRKGSKDGNEWNGHKYPLIRLPELGSFVIDVLYETSKSLDRQVIINYQELCRTCSQTTERKDPHLSRRYDEFVQLFGQSYGNELRKMERLIDDLLEEFVKRASASYQPKNAQALSKNRNMASSSVPKIAHNIAEKFEVDPQDVSFLRSLPKEWFHEVKASYA